MEPYFSITENARKVYSERYNPAINQINTEICYTKINAIYECHDEGFSPFHGKVLSLDFLLHNSSDDSLWKGCPSLYSQEVFDIITETVAADKYPYNAVILNAFKEKYHLTTECEFINSVVYCTQRFHQFTNYEANGLKLRQQYEGYEVVTKEFLERSLNQKILIAGVNDYCRVKKFNQDRFMYLLKNSRTRGYGFKMTELVKSYEDAKPRKRTVNSCP